MMKKRKQQLEEHGIKTIRFWDNEVLQGTERVLEQIFNTLEDLSVKKPHPALSS